jgi:two-component system, OmpR family, alkaline phosphatase synthesis response regulator PhoP
MAEKILLNNAAVGSRKTDQILKFDKLSIDSTRREVYLDETLLSLKPKEYEFLIFMAEHPGQVLSREIILERVWGWNYIGNSRTVDVHVRWLRKKIEADPANPLLITTVRGVGYRFDG